VHQWLDLLLLKKIAQSDQVLSKPIRFQPLEPLNAVWDYPFPAREKPAASNVEGETWDAMQAITTSGTT
jgi:hypothetical protein